MLNSPLCGAAAHFSASPAGDRTPETRKHVFTCHRPCRLQKDGFDLRRQTNSGIPRVDGVPVGLKSAQGTKRKVSVCQDQPCPLIRVRREGEK